MPLASAYQQYRQSAVQTADGGQLLLMSYEALLRWLGRARAAIEADNVPDAHAALINAQSLVANLSLSLDFERGGEVAENLRRLYDFMTGQLIQANTRKDPGLIDTVADLVRPLLEAWRVAVPQARQSVTAQAAGVVRS